MSIMRINSVGLNDSNISLSEEDKKEKLMLDSAKANIENRQLLIQQNEMLKTQLSQARQEARSAKIASLVSIGVAIISIGVSILLHFIG